MLSSFDSQISDPFVAPNNDPTMPAVPTYFPTYAFLPHPTLSHYDIFALSTDVEYTLEVLRTNPSLTPARMILSLTPAQLRELEKLSLRMERETRKRWFVVCVEKMEGSGGAGEGAFAVVFGIAERDGSEVTLEEMNENVGTCTRRSSMKRRVF